MRKSLLALIPLSLMACADPHQTESHCSAGPSEIERVSVHYGDSVLRVTPVVAKGKKNGEILFHLIPDRKASDPAGVNYETVEVTIRAKDTEANSWLVASGTASGDDPYVCVPGDAASGIVEYLVAVDKVGTLDPRVRVED